MKNRKHNLLSIFSKQKTLVAILAFFVVMPFLSNAFYSVNNISQMLLQSSHLVIIAVGVTFVMLCGAVDLSVGGIMCTAGIFACMLQAHLPLWLVLVIVLVGGGLIGAWNGFMVAKLKMHPFITTLGMGLILKGINLVVTETRTVLGTDPLFKEFGSFKFFNLVPLQFVIAVLIVVAAHLVLSRTAFGRNCYAVGGDDAVAKYSGINVTRQRVLAFIISGVMAALGGFFVSARMNAANATFGDLTSLLVNCSVVVGGTKMSGGVGGAFNTLIGVFLFAVLENSMNLLQINVYIQQACEGLIIVMILGITCLMRKRKIEDV